MFDPIESKPKFNSGKLNNILISKAAKLKLNQGKFNNVLPIPSAHRRNGELKKHHLKKNGESSLTNGTHCKSKFQENNGETFTSENIIYNSVKCSCESASLINSSSKTEIVFPKEKLIVTRSISQGILTKNNFIRKHIKLKPEHREIDNNYKNDLEDSKKKISNIVMKVVESKDVENISDTVCIDNKEILSEKVLIENKAYLHSEYCKEILKSKGEIKIEIEEDENYGTEILGKDITLVKVPYSLQRLAHFSNIHNTIDVDHQAERFSNEPSTTLHFRLLNDVNKAVEIKQFKKLRNTCLPKNMRKKYEQTFLNSSRLKSSSSEDGALINGEQTNEASIKCEWLDCKHHYRCKDKLTKHVKKEHLIPAQKNDVYICLWKDCKFFDQPSCSYRWLSRHVLNHCDGKPFKCVIQGCDLAFRSQEGLAKHVPTHFNERQVRRTCVMTSRNLNVTPSSTNHVVSKALSFTPHINENSNLSTPSSQCGSEDNVDYKYENVEKSMKYSYSASYPRKTFKKIHEKLLSSSSTQERFHGYNGDSFNISHVVTGKRTTLDGKTELYVTSSFPKTYPSYSFWMKESNVRKRKNLNVSIPCSRLSCDLKCFLFDIDNKSSRRKKKRK